MEFLRQLRENAYIESNFRVKCFAVQQMLCQI